MAFTVVAGWKREKVAALVKKSAEKYLGREVELEIVEEKIQMAERNGDDKAKVELIRLRQKLQREYERIQRMPFDGARMQRQRN